MRIVAAGYRQNGTRLIVADFFESLLTRRVAELAELRWT